MAKLTKKQTKALECILSDMVRAKSFVNGDTIALCRVADMATTTQHYVPNGPHTDGRPQALFPIMKDAGSEWCLADKAVRSLVRFLTENTETHYSMTANQKQ